MTSAAASLKPKNTEKTESCLRVGLFVCPWSMPVSFWVGSSGLRSQELGPHIYAGIQDPLSFLFCFGVSSVNQPRPPGMRAICAWGGPRHDALLICRPCRSFWFDCLPPRERFRSCPGQRELSGTLHCMTKPLDPARFFAPQ